MADFAKAFAPAYANGSGGVGMHSEMELPAEIVQEALHTETLGGTVSNAVKLGFAAGKGDGGLGLRPVLEEAASYQRNSS